MIHRLPLFLCAARISFFSRVYKMWPVVLFSICTHLCLCLFTASSTDFCSLLLIPLFTIQFHSMPLIYQASILLLYCQSSPVAPIFKSPCKLSRMRGNRRTVKVQSMVRNMFLCPMSLRQWILPLKISKGNLGTLALAQKASLHLYQNTCKSYKRFKKLAS